MAARVPIGCCCSRLQHWSSSKLQTLAAAAAATAQQQQQLQQQPRQLQQQLQQQQQHQLQQQQQQQRRHFSRFTSGGMGRAARVSQTLNPKPSSQAANPKPSTESPALQQPPSGRMSRTRAAGTGIDAFWDPTAKVEGLESQVAADFEEFTQLVGAAEARRQRLLLRQSLRRAQKLHDPLSSEHAQYFGQIESEAPPLPLDRPERFWDPKENLRRALKNKNLPITWKDVHLLGHFISSTGLLLPRRLTFASRLQQRFIYKAAAAARRMGLFPYDRRPKSSSSMPVMDPLQVPPAAGPAD
ncbi:ribosomal protein S18 domain containing protein, putative [Eimeria tenella]|uniref:Ribosomal protein S18 domain containing protein, putative n=1 Tax=Eimeria tenella TaxID=5802 RepID=U6L8Z7_EIMTE|nr:ribosomal protein S18 domain containing protein, putative [Eimeria tenella]CDJ44265.1 ribosomal protein S18 domain containing protein, putative [Eimeria tenella]|eukprot:XP_013235014.1 ribosomal protein S18 domain containing protein, putative [Eimeria tenella]